MAARHPLHRRARATSELVSGGDADDTVERAPLREHREPRIGQRAHLVAEVDGHQHRADRQLEAHRADLPADGDHVAGDRGDHPRQQVGDVCDEGREEIGERCHVGRDHADHVLDRAAAVAPRGRRDAAAVDDAECLIRPVVGVLDRHRAPHGMAEQDHRAGVQMADHVGELLGERADGHLVPSQRVAAAVAGKARVHHAPAELRGEVRALPPVHSPAREVAVDVHRPHGGAPRSCGPVRVLVVRDRVVERSRTHVEDCRDHPDPRSFPAHPSDRRRDGWWTARRSRRWGFSGRPGHVRDGSDLERCERAQVTSRRNVVK